MSMPEINISALQERNFVNGPGCRFVVWTQGCHLACPQCWNKHTWSFAKKSMMSVDALFEKIAATQGISGVTFTGGEPFLQAKALAALATRIKEELRLDLQIFTGFEIHELQKAPQKRLLALADIVVAGRFDPSRPNNNQKKHEISGNVRWQFNNSKVEVEIDEEGNLTITGYPTDKLIVDIKGATQRGRA